MVGQSAQGTVTKSPESMTHLRSTRGDSPTGSPPTPTPVPSTMIDLWTETSAALRKRLGSDVFDAHFAAFEVEADDRAGTLALVTPDAQAALVLERSYRDLVEQCARAVSGRELRVRIRHRAPEPPPEDAPPAPQLSLFDLVSDEPAPVSQRPVETPEPPAPTETGDDLERRIVASGLQRANDFGAFVVGTSNQFCWEAARAVAELPGQVYNPLFLYGGVGLGKTHLMQAIGIAAMQSRPGLRVRYLSAETFVNDMISAIGANRMDAFRQRNRQEVDLLLLDDVHFLEGKERTTEEFFHTFNSLVQAGKQIVVTSDRQPQDLQALESRVRSRLMMGLIADIQPPDFETRVAILERKATLHRYQVPREVTRYVADVVRSNVRELHGALHRIGTYARIHQVPVTLDLAREQLQRVTREQNARPTIDLVVKLVCEEMGVTPRDLKGRKRIAAIANPRKVAMYLARKHTDASYPELGRFFGDRDHTTVLSACQGIESALSVGDPIRTVIERVERRLSAV